MQNIVHDNVALNIFCTLGPGKGRALRYVNTPLYKIYKDNEKIILDNFYENEIKKIQKFTRIRESLRSEGEDDYVEQMSDYMRKLLGSFGATCNIFCSCTARSKHPSKCSFPHHGMASQHRIDMENACRYIHYASTYSARRYNGVSREMCWRKVDGIDKWAMVFCNSIKYSDDVILFYCISKNSPFFDHALLYEYRACVQTFSSIQKHQLSQTFIDLCTTKYR